MILLFCFYYHLGSVFRIGILIIIMVITLVLFCPSLTAFWTQTILPSSKVTKDFTWTFYRWDWLIWKDSWISPQEREGGFFKSNFSGFTCRPSGVDSSNSSLSCKLDNWRKSNEACERILQFKSTIVLFSWNQIKFHIFVCVLTQAVSMRCNILALHLTYRSDFDLIRSTLGIKAKSVLS